MYCLRYLNDLVSNMLATTGGHCNKKLSFWNVFIILVFMLHNFEFVLFRYLLISHIWDIINWLEKQKPKKNKNVVSGFMCGVNPHTNIIRRFRVYVWFELTNKHTSLF